MKTRLLLASVFVLMLLVAFQGAAWALPDALLQPQDSGWLKAWQYGDYGYVLTDGKGWVLYSYAGDKPGVSNCYGPCAAAWPPYLIKEGVYPQADWQSNHQLGTYKRPDGYYQVTYNNIPLYYYAQDQKAGDTYGHGYGGVWSAVKADYAPAAPAYAPPKPQPYSENKY